MYFCSRKKGSVAQLDRAIPRTRDGSSIRNQHFIGFIEFYDIGSVAQLDRAIPRMRDGSSIRNQHFIGFIEFYDIGSVAQLDRATAF